MIVGEVKVPEMELKTALKEIPETENLMKDLLEWILKALLSPTGTR